jgi:uncharacterized protein DUF2490
VKRWLGFVLFGLVCAPLPAGAQATGQAWANVIIDWLPTNRLSYELDVEPKFQAVVHDGQPTWTDLDVTPQVNYALSPWLDVLGEVDVGYQAQSNEVNSMSMTPRIGTELHILSRLLQPAGGHGQANEKLPRRRADFGSLLRLEHEDTFYGTSAVQKSTWRVRDRFRIAYPLNSAKVTNDGTIYATSDAELFLPIDQTVRGGAVSEVRVRAGIGYRESFGWRYEALYIWTGERNADSGAMAVHSHAIDVRIKRQF